MAGYPATPDIRPNPILDTQFNEPTNPNFFKVPKVILPTNKKTLGILKLEASRGVAASPYNKVTGCLSVCLCVCLYVFTEGSR